MKIFLLYFLSCILSQCPISAQDRPDKLSAIQQAQISALQKSVVSIGTIVHSLLSETQFQKLNGPNWVMMRGQTLATETPLCQLLMEDKRDCTLPDASGLFFRGSGGKAGPLGKIQGQATSPNGLSAVTTRSSDSTVSVGGSLSARFEPSGPLLNPYRIETQYTDREGGANVGIPFAATGNSTGGTWKTVLSGEDETRPINLSVNVFIRVR